MMELFAGRSLPRGRTDFDLRMKSVFRRKTQVVLDESMGLCLEFPSYNFGRTAKVVVRGRRKNLRGLEIQLDSIDTAWSSGRFPLKSGLKLPVSLSALDRNLFKAFVFGDEGVIQKRFEIVRKESRPGGVRAMRTLSLAVLSPDREKMFFPIVDAGDSLPKKGRVVLKMLPEFCSSQKTQYDNSCPILSLDVWASNLDASIMDYCDIGRLDVGVDDTEYRSFEGDISEANIVVDYDVDKFGFVVFRAEIESAPNMTKLNKVCRYAWLTDGIEYPDAQDFVRQESGIISSAIKSLEEIDEDHPLSKARDVLDRFVSSRCKTVPSSCDSAQELLEGFFAIRRNILEADRKTGKTNGLLPYANVSHPLRLFAMDYMNGSGDSSLIKLSQKLSGFYMMINHRHLFPDKTKMKRMSSEGLRLLGSGVAASNLSRSFSSLFEEMLESFVVPVDTFRVPLSPMFVVGDVWDKDPVLPAGHILPTGKSIRSLLSCDGFWQIYSTSCEGSVLLVETDLAGFWERYGFVEKGFFAEISFNGKIFRYIDSEKENAFLHLMDHKNVPGKYHMSNLSSLDESPVFPNFMESIKIARDKVDRESKRGAISLADSIYIPGENLLLPVFCKSRTDGDDASVALDWYVGKYRGPDRMATTSSGARMHRWYEDIAEKIESDDKIFRSRAKKDAAQANGQKKSNLPRNRTGSQRDLEKGASASAKKAELGNIKPFRLPGRADLEKFVNEEIIDVINDAETYKKFGFGFPGAVVLHGPPGSGKSHAVAKIAEHVGWPVVDFNFGSLGSSKIHETPALIGSAFKSAFDSAPSIIVIDEMEGFLMDRTKDGNASTTGFKPDMEEMGEFLKNIPLAREKKVLVFGMTNVIDIIDPAVMRQGRFDHSIYVGMASREEVADLMEFLFEGIPVAESVDMSAIADRLAGRPCSDAESVMRKSGKIAAKLRKDSIDQECIDQALDALPKIAEETRRPIGFYTESDMSAG